MFLQKRFFSRQYMFESDNSEAVVIKWHEHLVDQVYMWHHLTAADSIDLILIIIVIIIEEVFPSSSTTMESSKKWQK